jgi:DNA-directed RNA polymerase specialized sigma24 family protein
MSANGSLFATTHWSIVVAAGDATSPQAREALERLCKSYWYPLYAFVRRRGRNSHDAKDLTQAFFLQLLEHGYLSRADPRKGRFRTFMLVALNHFLTNQWHHANAQKRGGDAVMLSLDEVSAEHRYGAEPFAADHPERLFEKRWALTVVDRALSHLQQEFADSGRSELFEALKGVLTGAQVTEAYSTLAGRFGLTEAAVKMTVVRLRRRFGEVLRVEVGHTVSSESEIDDELRHLLRVVADSGES